MATTTRTLVETLQDAAEKIGASVLIEPEWRCVGQITYRSGLRRYFKLATLDLNTVGASSIARDKGYTRFFLGKMGYPVPEGRTYLTPQWARTLGAPDGNAFSDAWAFAKQIGLPVFVKPNSLSGGRAVSKASSWKEFRRGVSEAMKLDEVIVIEKAVPGCDYRVVVLDGRVISAYQRIPLAITGDGVSTIRQLITQKEARFATDGRGKRIDVSDYRVQAILHSNHMTLDTVAGAGTSIRLLDNANLSAGGTSIDVTDSLHGDFKSYAVKVAKDMGLRLSGVDLIVDGDISAPPQAGHHWIIEINSAPGLDHYASIGPRQREIVDQLYLEVVKSMEHA